MDNNTGQPVAYKIRGTYTSKDTSTLIFIGLIFCAENVCAQTPTKIFLPDENLVNTINKYQILTHRQKLKLKNSFFYRRIHLLKTKGKFPFE